MTTIMTIIRRSSRLDCIVLACLCVLVICCLMAHVAEASDPAASDQNEENLEEGKEQLIEYAKGSVCQYCQYCEFCSLCDEDCPCPKKSKRPACHMCKYCTYCKFCTLCDAICQPGGVVDRVSGSLISLLPSVDHDQVDSDIEGVEDEIFKKRAKSEL